MTSERGPSYLELILAAHRAGKIPPGTVTDCFVLHSSDCPFPAAKGQCSCAPEVKIVSPAEPDGVLE